jgi:predicted peptidase
MTQHIETVTVLDPMVASIPAKRHEHFELEERIKCLKNYLIGVEEQSKKAEVFANTSEQRPSHNKAVAFVKSYLDDIGQLRNMLRTTLKSGVVVYGNEFGEWHIINVDEMAVVEFHNIELSHKLKFSFYCPDSYNNFKKIADILY